MPIKRIIPVFLRKILQTFAICREKNPSEKANILTAITPIVIKSDNIIPVSLFQEMRSGNIFQCTRLAKSIISFMNSTGTTEIAPAIIPRPNLRAPSGELSRYENIYPHKRMGRKVIITMGMSEKISIKISFGSTKIYFRKISYFPNLILSLFPFLNTLDIRNIFTPMSIKKNPIM